MKVAIVGSRNFKDLTKLCKIVDPYLPKITRIISGSARGTDAMAEIYAYMHKIPFTCYPAEWDKYGKSAGYLRNITIVENADMVIAFPTQGGKSTQHTIKIASDENIPVLVTWI